MAAARTVKEGPITYVLAIFGDSISDTGNTFRAAGVPDPRLYYQGRFSDGPNWVDYLGAYLNKTVKTQVLNYAYGGAFACVEHLPATWRFTYVQHLVNQTATFQADVLSGKVPAGKNVRVIPIQFIGPNDVRSVLSEALQGKVMTQAQTVAFVARIIGCRLASAGALAAMPGVRDVVLMPILPIHLAPQVPLFLKPQVKQLVGVLDQQLTSAAKALQAQLAALPAGSPGAGVRLHLLGDSTWLERGQTNIQPPFANSTGYCLSNLPPSVLLLAPNTTKCADPQNYLFYDNVHLTSRINKWLALEGVLPRLRQLRVLPA